MLVVARVALPGVDTRLQIEQLQPARGGAAMKRHFPGLHAEPNSIDDSLEGVFLVRVDRAYYRWHPQKPFFVLCFAILEPKELASTRFRAGSIAPRNPSGN